MVGTPLPSLLHQQKLMKDALAAPGSQGPSPARKTKNGGGGGLCCFSLPGASLGILPKAIMLASGLIWRFFTLLCFPLLCRVLSRGHPRF